jgi:hypothetical protein
MGHVKRGLYKRGRCKDCEYSIIIESELGLRCSAKLGMDTKIYSGRINLPQVKPRMKCNWYLNVIDTI